MKKGRSFLTTMLFFVVVLFFVGIGIVVADHTAEIVAVPSFSEGVTNVSINFSINNSATSAGNLTAFNITVLNTSNVSLLELLDNNTDLDCSLASSLLACNFTTNLTAGSSSWVLVNVSFNDSGNYSFNLTSLDDASATNNTLLYFSAGILDGTNPTVTLNSPEDAFNSSSASITFNCSASDAVNVSNVTLYGNWSSWHANETNSSLVSGDNVTFTKTLSDGFFTWNCYACDNSSNCAFASSNRTFALDATAPVIANISLSDYIFQNNTTVTVTVNVTDEFSDVTNVTANDVQLENISEEVWEGNLSLNDSVSNVTVVATDLFGTNVTNDSVLYTVDDDVPVVTLNTPNANNWTDASDPFEMKFNCSVADGVGLDNVSLYLTNPSNTSFSYNTSRSLFSNESSAQWMVNLSNGNYTWNCLAYDAANNSAWASTNRSIKINASTPDINVTKTNTTGNYTLYANLQFLINVTNKGTADFDEVNLSDVFNDTCLNFTWTNLSGSTNGTGTINWSDITSGTFTAGSYKEILVNFTIDEVCDTQNEARVNATVNGNVFTSTASDPFTVLSGLSVFVDKSLVNEQAEYVPGETLEFLINITNNGLVDITAINVTDTYNASCMNYSNSSIASTANGTGEVNWTDLSGTPLAPNGYIELYTNFTALAACTNTNNTALVNATDGSTLTSAQHTPNAFSIASGISVLVSMNGSTSNPQQGDMMDIIINVTNNGLVDLTDINVTLTFNDSCVAYNSSEIEPNATGTTTVNWTDAVSVPLENDTNDFWYTNFSAEAECSQTNITVMVNATNGTYTTYDTAVHTFGITPSAPAPQDEGLDSWQSSIVSPYVVENNPKLMNFTIYRQAFSDSLCLKNLTIRVPDQFNVTNYNTTNAINNTFSKSGKNMTWTRDTQGFFCGQGPYNFVINVTSNRSNNFTSDAFEVVAYNTNDEMSGINLSVYTTLLFSYNGTVFSTNGTPLEGVLASVSVITFSMDGDVNFGTFSNTTDENGTFNITGIPSLNQTDMGGFGGAGDGTSLFYSLSAVKYNDSENRYGMYVGPSLPEFPESELRNMLNDVDIYLRPAVTFELYVQGYNYSGNPSNENDTCPGPSCDDPNWEPEWPWVNLSFGYSIKDTKLGYPFSSSWTQSDSVRYISAPRNRNYSIMVFPSSSFPLTIDFENATSNCTAGGVDISQAGVNASCTQTAGTYVVNATINTSTNFTPIVGYVNLTNLDSLFIVSYMFEGGDMIFEDRTFPFNMGNMQNFPSNSSLNDKYNLTEGSYNITLPATEATSFIMLRAYGTKNGVTYADSYKLSANNSGFNLDADTLNFSLKPLINGTERTIYAQNISANWNNTLVVNTSAVQFNFVNENGTLLTTENSFVEMKRTLNGEQYLHMTNGANGSFSVSLLENESLTKLTVYSQSYSPIVMPVSSAILNGSVNDSKISCLDGICNITLEQFDPFDPESNASLNVTMSMYRSNSTCDVPNPENDCLLGGMGDIEKSSFSPLQAILSGDVSLRIGSGNISVHYANTDLLASGPPDAAFSQNSSGDDLNAAWKFGSSGPDIYEYVLISMPYADSLQTQQINVSINLLYDHNFEVVWNGTESDYNITNLTGGDYADYLNNDYEAYLNGTGVICNETDENLSNNLCYKDLTNKLIWMKIPHFSGVGPEIQADDLTDPTVTLNAPNANNWTDASDPFEMTFNCSVTDNVNLSNVTLYLTNNTNGTFSANTTTDFSTNESSAQWLVNLSNGNYTWNCLATDSSNNTDWGDSNRTIKVNYTAGPGDTTEPTVSLLSPSAAYNSTSQTVTFNCSASDAVNVSNVTLYGNWSSWHANETNSSLVSGDNVTFTKTLSDGFFTWNCYACDNSSNCAFASSNRTFTLDVTAPVINNITLNDSYVQNNTNVSITVNATDALSGVSTVTAQGNSLTNSAGDLWTATITLNDSVSNVTVVVTDAFGTATTNDTTTYTIDDTKPTTTVTNLAAADLFATDDGNMFINWTDDNENYSHWIYRNASTNITTLSGLTKLASVAAGITNYTDNTTVNGTNYSYAVMSVDRALNYNTSKYLTVNNSVVNDTVMPLSPTALNATNQTNAAVLLNWTGVVLDTAGYADSQGMTYIIFRGANASAINETYRSNLSNQLGNTTNTSYLDTTITQSNSYTYIITSFDDGDNHNTSNTSENTVSITTLSACTNSWSAWSTCSGGTKSRTRTCYGGGYTNNIQTQSSTDGCTTTGSSPFLIKGSPLILKGDAPPEDNETDDDDDDTNQTQDHNQTQENQSDENKSVFHIPPGKGLQNNEKLKEAVEKVLAKGKMNENAVQNLLELSAAISGDVELDRSFKQEEGKSAITSRFQYKGTKKAKDFVIYEVVPKSFADHADKITITTNGKVEVVNPDPEFLFHFDVVSPAEQILITYEVDEEVEEAVVEEFSTELYASELEEPSVEETDAAEDETNDEKTGDGFPWLALVIIVVVLGLLVGAFYFFKKEHRHNGDAHHLFDEHHAKGHGHVEMHKTQDEEEKDKTEGNT